MSSDPEESPEAENEVPGNPEVWATSPLGDPSKWHPTLKSFASFITTLPHPAALFWGDELVLVQNDRWKQVAGSDDEQGKAQVSSLSEVALVALQNVLHSHAQHDLAPLDLLNGNSQDGRSYDLLLSPINSGNACGAIAQLFPSDLMEATVPKKPASVAQSNDSEPSKKAKAHGRGLDDLPLDQHPFFQRFAAMIPTGLAILNQNAEAVFVNRQFYDLTTHQDENKSFRSWPQTIHPDDYDRVMKAYQDAFNSGEQLTCEFRTQGHEENPWRLLLLTPLGDDDLQHESLREHGGFICAIIDITPNKLNEIAQEHAAKEAQERKEQQERFIDMISHEIRNPLSAVLHCAEDIMETVETGSDSSGKTTISKAAMIEAAETIFLCVNHQQHIVDDILSFSKLDASMLSLTPRSVQPKRQLADSLKMFQPEFRKQSMNFEYKVDYSYDEIEIDFVQADLIRISQVLVNLVTNSIKFTAKKEGEKKITVVLGASLKRPTSYPPNVVFFDSDDVAFRMDATNTSEWGNGEALYILVAVMDTGIGISTENQRKLFERFRQATPKTEEIYGGSGLGLNIARKLCQLHGGEIGVSSKEGEGSTFGFFFKVRRTELKDAQEPPPRDQLLRSILQERVQEESKDAPIEEVDEEDVPQDLQTPPVSHVPEVSVVPHQDGQWDHTANIASTIEHKPIDEYEVYKRPSVPKREHPSRLEKLQKLTDSDLSNQQFPVREKAYESSTQVLLVEDNIINQRILRRKLESKGFIVTTANNGREAVDAVHNASTEDEELHAFDIILMDQEMPVLDGNSATKAIRELEAQGVVSHTPILGVTANVRVEQKDEMKAAGMDDVISKPYRIDEMVDRIKKMTLDDAK